MKSTIHIKACTWRQKRSRGYGGILLTALFSVACSAYFLIHPRNIYPEVATPHHMYSKHHLYSVRANFLLRARIWLQIKYKRRKGRSNYCCSRDQRRIWRQNNNNKNHLMSMRKSLMETLRV